MATRRHFIRSTSQAAGGLALAFQLPLPLIAQTRKHISPNDRIGLGLIGCNGMGFSNLSSFLKMDEVEVVALCDVDKNVIRRRGAELKEAGFKVPKSYGDYRQLLEDKDVDIVIVGTPDHWHCLQLIHALEAGKDVYCEKPIANSIQECELMRLKVSESDRMVQIGQWQRSQPHFRDAIDFVHSGKLGEIRLVKTWAYQGWMTPIPLVADSTPPEGVDYGMWLGPAPIRAFNQNRFHFNFRWFWDYAGGLMTDWGVHLIDYALFGMKAGMPNSAMALGGKFAYPNDASETPDTLQTVFEYENFSMLWEHATGIDGGNYGRNHGIAFIGNQGTLVLDRGGWEVIPEVAHESWRMLKDQPKIEAVPLQQNQGNGLDLHTRNFVDVVKSRQEQDLRAPLEVGYNAAMTCHMGNIAFKTGQRIHWDAGKNAFQETEANQLCSIQYHNGWKLPG